MPRSLQKTLVLAVTALFVLLASSAAFAGSKGGGGAKQAGGDKPKESVSLNYGKVEYSRTQKNKATPSLYNKTSSGKHYSKTVN